MPFSDERHNSGDAPAPSATDTRVAEDAGAIPEGEPADSNSADWSALHKLDEFASPQRHWVERTLPPRDRVSFVFFASNAHDENQPVHLKVGHLHHRHTREGTHGPSIARQEQRRRRDVELAGQHAGFDEEDHAGDDGEDRRQRQHLHVRVAEVQQRLDDEDAVEHDCGQRLGGDVGDRYGDGDRCRPDADGDGRVLPLSAGDGDGEWR